MSNKTVLDAVKYLKGELASSNVCFSGDYLYWIDLKHDVSTHVLQLAGENQSDDAYSLICSTSEFNQAVTEMSAGIY